MSYAEMEQKVEGGIFLIKIKTKKGIRTIEMMEGKMKLEPNRKDQEPE